MKNLFSYREYLCHKQIFLKHIFILQKKNFDHKNVYLLQLPSELNNLVLKVSEAPNLQYSLS